ncbi:integrase [Cereibacter sphaeroides]|nr:integrase [Cereibacter sphaeroides]
MVTVKLRGVNTVRKRLAGGGVKTYRYHRATGTLLPGDPGSAEFLKAYAEAEKMQPHDVNNVAALIRAFLLSPRFERSKKGRPRAESTKKEYRRMLTAVEAEFGKLPIAALASPKVRAVFADYHENIGEDRPREADNRMTVLSLVFSYAASRGTIKANPLEGFERLYSGDRSEIIWTEADVSRFMTEAPVELKRAMILAIHTGQRYGDLIRLTWSDFDGTTLRLKQSKTKARVAVRCTAALLRMLETAPRTSTYILTRHDGRPWFTENNDKELGKAWRRHMEAAGFYPRPFAELTKQEKAQHLHFNDLRGTAVTLLAEAGATVPQICAITGHTLASATRILERYLAMTEALSSAAIIAFENAPETAFANRLQTGAGEGGMVAARAQGKQ